MALPTGACQKGEETHEGSGGSFVPALVGVTAGRFIRNVAAQITGTCPSYCVENELYAVSTLFIAP